MSTIFQPNVLDWFLGAGVGTNLGAALVGVVFGIVWSRTRFWPLRPICHALERMHAHHEWQAQHLARLLEHHGVPVDAHPHFDLSTEEESSCRSG